MTSAFFSGGRAGGTADFANFSSAFNVVLPHDGGETAQCGTMGYPRFAPRPEADDFKSSQSLAVSKAWLRGFPRTEQKQGVNVGNDLPPALSHALSQIGVVNPRPPTPRPACYAAPQWKPTAPDEDPPF